PYAGKKLSMIIFLPKATDGLLDLERQLTAGNLQAWLTSLHDAHEHETAIYLPRFRVENSFDLVQELAGLGMPSLFSKRDADLSGMTGAHDLFISDVIHKAFVEVNEEGTEAAATTRLQGKPRSRTNQFITDHPF